MELVIDVRYMYLAVLLTLFGIFMAVIFSVLFISKKIGLWGIFARAGEKEWKSIIPFYNQITLLKVCKLKPSLILLYIDFIIPIIGYLAGRDVKFVMIIMTIGFIIYRYMIAIRLGQAYKKGDVFSFLLAFFPSIFFPIIGCSKGESYTEVEVKELKKK